MVGKVLTGNGITAYGNGAYSLIGGGELSDAERDALQQLCRQRLDAFRAQRGKEEFAHLSSHQSSASITWTNWSARAGMLSETICQMVSSSRPK
ncbi:hypothetical protein Cyagr_1743 [Cyanobium gracile PCC 6307]|uniref:Uncharacterized protein n=1 Tax=Cyanobium gracile (strain ATCC 27147 / PCC 6307) TaxID=292564 RepID=K9P712_CYAGP|nr:hypothetical protein [Cyanobium gracile]AFY28890.1 hypothetical protein Cyagr_1743 [Cyanobium gracile PCC 6307]